MSAFPRFILYGIGSVLFVVGLIALLAPDRLLQPAGIGLNEPSAYAEVRAAYAGTFFAIGWAAVQAVRNPKYSRFVLVILAILLGTFTAARTLSLIIDGQPNAIAWVNHSAEAIGFILVILAYRACKPHETES